MRHIRGQSRAARFDDQREHGHVLSRRHPIAPGWLAVVRALPEHHESAVERSDGQHDQRQRPEFGRLHGESARSGRCQRRDYERRSCGPHVLEPADDRRRMGASDRRRAHARALARHPAGDQRLLRGHEPDDGGQRPPFYQYPRECENLRGAGVHLERRHQLRRRLRDRHP